MPTVYYLRHAETEWNAAGRLQGQHDSPLGARGRDQARRCADILRDLFAGEGRSAQSYDYVCSPLGRACETMRLVRAALGLPPEGSRTDARLIEIGFGEWEGLTLAEVQARAPDLLAMREHDKWGFCPPGGESYVQVAARMGEWYAGLARDTVVTAHGGTARALLAHLDIVPPEVAVTIGIDHGVVYVISGRTWARYS
jgi:probable phosphoglycerate mutase